jgi:eukaryotic-like serine/threonine-protein kinase
VTSQSRHSPGFLGDAERLARFDREARMLAALNHPHIGGIYGVVDIDGTPALVLELIDGEMLADDLDAPSGGGWRNDS